MNYGPLLFFGIFLTLASSWCGLVLIPQLQYGGMGAVHIEETNEIYPQVRPGLAQRGQQVYRAYGCIYCHSQQVRPKGFGSDFERNWGPRRSVARDYIYDRPVMLGTMRTGPDLTNIGARQPSQEWQHLHLYNPVITSPGSIMPPHPFLYQKRRILGEPSPNALNLTGKFALEPGYEIIPTPEAEALVAYLLSLKATAPLPEAK